MAVCQMQAPSQASATQALSPTGLSTSALTMSGIPCVDSQLLCPTLRTSLAVYGKPAASQGVPRSSSGTPRTTIPASDEARSTDEPGSVIADAESAAAQWAGNLDSSSLTTFDGSPTDIGDLQAGDDAAVAEADGSLSAERLQLACGEGSASILNVEELEMQMMQRLPRGGAVAVGDREAESASGTAGSTEAQAPPAVEDALSNEQPVTCHVCAEEEVVAATEKGSGEATDRADSPVERRIAPTSGREYTYDEFVEAWSQEHAIEELQDYWETSMRRKEPEESAAKEDKNVQKKEEPELEKASKDAELQTRAAVSGETPNEKPDEQNTNSGRLLLLLLKGTQVPNQPGAAGVLPERLRDERWEPLLQPFANPDDPKRFVGADQFGPGHGVAVSGTGSQPVVLKDIPKADILVMFKPSGWATCSTPQWEGVEGNLIRYIWQRHANCSMAAPCHRLDRGTSGAVVVAKTRNALRHIATQITSRTLVKQYFGLCHGKIDPPQGALSLPLALSSTDKPLGACAAEGRPAVTRYRVLGYFSRPTGSADDVAYYSLVQLQIDHGRQHQIRLHMASMGHPIVYDAKYNAQSLREDAKVCTRLYLHAAFVQCSLPPDGTEMLRVACRLPLQLKHALTNALERERSLEDQLPAEARRLCDCLLDAEPGVVSSASLFEARLAARRRNDFLKSFNFSNQEKDEVLRILARLPTAEERSSALLRFRVLGERTPDFIVTRFERYVEGLLRQKNQGARKAEDDTQESEESSGKALEEAQDSAPPLPTAGGYGPVSFHTEHVTCDVCGALEKVDIVGFPAMRLGLRCRSLVAPAVTMPVSGPLARLLANANKRSAPSESQTEADRSESTDEQDEDDEQDEEEDQEEEEEEEEDDEDDDEEEEEDEDEEDEEDENEEDEDSDGKVEPHHWWHARSTDSDLGEELLSVLRENGGTMNGPLVASMFASRYNSWVRKDSRRNDGSLRRWIGEQPGVSVEHCGGNKWKVHLDPSYLHQEHWVPKHAGYKEWRGRSRRSAWH